MHRIRARLRTLSIRLPSSGDERPSAIPDLGTAARTLANADREHILEALKQTNWLIGGQDGAANRLGLPRTTLIYKMRKPGI